MRLVGPLPSYRPAPTRARSPGQPIPYISVKQAGSDGEELTDYDIIGSNAEGTGLFALDRCERVDLVCVPSPPGRDLGSTSFVAATRYCERRRALLVWDPPWSWTSADSAVLCAARVRAGEPARADLFPARPAARRSRPLRCRDAGMRRRRRHARALRSGRRLAPHAARRHDAEGRSRAVARNRPEAGRELATHGREHVHSAAARRRGAARQRQLRGRRGARLAVAELGREPPHGFRPALDRGADALGVLRRQTRPARGRLSSARCGFSCRD